MTQTEAIEVSGVAEGLAMIAGELRYLTQAVPLTAGQRLYLEEAQRCVAAARASLKCQFDEAFHAMRSLDMDEVPF